MGAGLLCLWCVQAFANECVPCLSKPRRFVEGTLQQPTGPEFDVLCPDFVLSGAPPFIY